MDTTERLGWLQGFARRDARDAERLDAEKTDIARLIDGCEYELRRVERDVADTRAGPDNREQTMATASSQPFQIEARLRDPSRRRDGAWWQALGLSP